jgi:hypothetical protein
VVLETREIDGKERLVPERVELRLRPLRSGTRDLEVELEGVELEGAELEGAELEGAELEAEGR